MDDLKANKVGLWLIDVQQRLFPLVDRQTEVLERMCFMVQAAQCLALPIFVTEQYPQGLGHTIDQIKQLLPAHQTIYSKTTFSGCREPKIHRVLNQIDVDVWVLIGIEAHICVFQTAKDLLSVRKKVVVLKDATSSRRALDFSAAIDEMQNLGIRVSTAETVVYEMVEDAANPEFKSILPLVRGGAFHAKDRS